MNEENAVALIKQDRNYVSVFEDPSTYKAKMEIASALSRTPFVPESFRGKAEDCLVALDMAGRLGLNPLAVFPDIYVIDNRASFSSKFLIALVNRSGRFSRIRFEEGIDGEVEVTFSGWGDARGQRRTWKEKVPNYYSIATFKELSSGEVFTSPRIDMKFAEKNGWVQKNGSKWQTKPQIMCRNRSA
ncbi:MAG: recombinase RecT, partial [Thermoguttaceae bacterium]|nr:recombinase RecT [Thermoguttaceae bacterium]